MKVLTSSSGIYPVFELSHNSCMTIRRAPQVLLRVKNKLDATVSVFRFEDIKPAVEFWNNNLNNMSYE